MIDQLNAALADKQYTLERELGRGGMATVFLADDLKHHRKVAIKVLHPELAAVLGGDRFLREIEIAAGLTHPHILPLHDSGQADTFLYYVMPYVDGESLRDRLDRESQLPIEDAVGIAREVADGLSYAHGLGVVHRDIKPENILLSGDHALLADFGIARAVSEAGGSRLTETGLSLGTPHYMSPEQASGAEAVDARSDVYSLGCVTYEMLAGEPPHTGPNAQAIIAKVLTQPTPSVRVVRNAVPPATDVVLSKALSRLPADRFPTAGGFSAALNASVTSDAVARGTRATPGARDTIRTRKTVTIATAAIAIVALGAVAFWGPWQDAPPADSASVYRLTMQIAPLAVTDHTPGSAVALSPDGSTVAYVSGSGGAGQIYLRRLDETDATPVPGAENAVSPFFSPDGEWLGFAANGKLTKLRISDGTRVTLCDAEAMHGATWGTDGTIVFGGTVENMFGLSRISADGGTPEQLTTRGGTSDLYLLFPAMLPGNDAVLFTAGNATGMAMNISLLDLRTGEREILVEGGGNARYLPQGYLVYAQDDGLYAVRFDAQERAVHGSPVKVVQANVAGFASEPALGHFDVSANGTLVYLAGDELAAAQQQLVWVDREGSVELIAVPGGRDEGNSGLAYMGPRVSSDAERVVFWNSSPGESSRKAGFAGDLWLANLARGVRSRMSSDSLEQFWAVWYPDGRRVAFTAGGADQGSVGLLAERADGMGPPVRLTTVIGTQWQQPYSFTADGEFLYYQESSQGVDFDIYVLPLSGDAEPQPVVDGPAEEFHPAVSPDGRWLAYVSDESGQSEIYLTDLPDRRGRSLVSSDGGIGPAWAPDGGELYYVQSVEGQTALIAVRVETTPALELSRPETLFRGPFTLPLQFGRSYDVSPDGERFLMVRRPVEVESLERLSVVINWVDELEELVGP